MKRKALLFAAIACLCTISFRTTLLSQSTPGADSLGIISRFNEFQDALQKRDSIAIGDFYGTDAVSLLQNQPARRGRQAIAARWTKVLMGPFTFHISPQDVNVSSSGHDAFQYGRFEIQSTDPSKAILASGNVMFVWRKQEATWRIAFEMDNFDAPSSPGKKDK
ncbi:MAG TPA: nuclear transport factor 2 family protein [Bacteroidota bacterium]|nr:nuclear transport factor 2 family protein [Bacteroidota bacterium]